MGKNHEYFNDAEPTHFVVHRKSGYAKNTVKGFRGRPWKLCLNDDCPSMVEMRQKRAERERAREAREKAKAADNGASADAEAKAKAPSPGSRGNGRRRARRKPPSPGTARTKRAGTRTKK